MFGAVYLLMHDKPIQSLVALIVALGSAVGPKSTPTSFNQKESVKIINHRQRSQQRRYPRHVYLHRCEESSHSVQLGRFYSRQNGQLRRRAPNSRTAKARPLPQLTKWR